MKEAITNQNQYARNRKDFHKSEKSTVVIVNSVLNVRYCFRKRVLWDALLILTFM